jgi:hypothetical protein
MKKTVVYTCIINNYDSLNEIQELEENIDYLCFTNTEITSKTWQIVKIENVENLDNSRFSKAPKIRPHLYLEDYDTSIWIDGNIQVKGHINELLKSLDNTCFHVSRHPSTNCIYKEAQVVVAYKVADPELVGKQMSKYRQEDYPENNGLIAGGIIIREHNAPFCIKISEEWWKEILCFSKRDQLSFNYIVWKNPDFKFEYIREGFHKLIMDGKYFKYLPHLPKKK